MDITLEQVEELRRRADLSYEEARAALQAANGSLLDALITLERAGRLPGGQGGSYSHRGGAKAQTAQAAASHGNAGKQSTPGGESPVSRFFRRLVDILRPTSDNRFELWRQDEMTASMPILILVILLAAFFYIALPLLIVGLFFGFRYRFSGPDLGRQDLNSAMDKVSDTVDSVKSEFNKK